MSLRPPDFQGPMGPTLEGELRLIELLLDDVGLDNLRRRLPLHPAITRYDSIRAFIDHKFWVSYLDETDVILQVGSTILDNLGLGTPVEDIISAIDDKEVLQQLRRRILDPEQFKDQMAAFSCWALLNNKGVSAKLVEKTGLPDICVSISHSEQEWTEVKRIRTGTDPTRARRVIQKANQQIKTVTPTGAGSLFLSIERQQLGLVFDDRIPPDIQPYVNEVDRELGSDSSKSVHSVIVTWDDFMLFADSPEKTGYYLRRRSIVRHHCAPRLKSKLPASAFELGRTVALRGKFNWSGGEVKRPSPIQVGNITVTEQFRTECEKGGYVRAVHAVAALQNPDSIVRYDLGGLTMVLATRRVTTARVPYTLLLIACVPEADRLEIMLGFRIYNIDPDALTSHPFTLFSTFLERYGYPIRVGSHYGVFIPNVVVCEDPSQVVRGDRPAGEKLLVCANIKVLDMATHMVHVTWAFGILMQRYEKDVETHWH